MKPELQNKVSELNCLLRIIEHRVKYLRESTLKDLDDTIAFKTDPFVYSKKEEVMHG